MKTRLLLLLAVLTIASAQVTIKTSVQLVRMLVSVKDEYSRVVVGLDKRDFSITDNGVPQEIRLFERETSQPLSIALLIDISGSTHKDIKYEIDAVQRFFTAAFRTGNPDDAISLYSFNWEVNQHSGFTRSQPELQRRLRELHPEAGTAMYDALWWSANNLRDRQGRHVIVLITDGGDTTSAKTYQEAVRSMHRADVVLYAVLVMPITNDAGRNIGGENALTTMTQELGGRVFAPAVATSLNTSFDEILKELRTQYLIGYYPTGLPYTKELFHKVIVRTTHPEYNINARTGYYGSADSMR